MLEVAWIEDPEFLTPQYTSMGDAFLVFANNFFNSGFDSILKFVSIILQPFFTKDY